MRLKIYQIDPDKDPERVRFEPLDRVGTVDSAMYRKVFDAEADVKGLEDAFILFNNKGHPLHNGRAMAVSDVVVTDKGAFYCDTFGFKPVEFDESKADMTNLIKILYVPVHEKPYEAEIPNTLAAKQKAVGGLIEFVFNPDDTTIVCDEEAKLKNKDGNRYLDGGGIIAGNFFVEGNGEENCRSLTDEEIQKYKEKYAEAPDISPEETAADVGFRFINFM